MHFLVSKQEAYGEEEEKGRRRRERRRKGRRRSKQRYVNGTQYCIYDNVNTTTVVVSFWTFVYDMLIYYKTWIYQCLILQVKSSSIYVLASRNPIRIR